jgi:hypothetical protein
MMRDDLGVIELNNRPLNAIVDLPIEQHKTLRWVLTEHAKSADDVRSFELKYASFCAFVACKYNDDHGRECGIASLGAGWLQTINKHNRYPYHCSEYVTELFQCFMLHNY